MQFVCVFFHICRKFEFLISRGSVATCPSTGSVSTAEQGMAQTRWHCSLVGKSVEGRLYSACLALLEPRWQHRRWSVTWVRAIDSQVERMRTSAEAHRRSRRIRRLLSHRSTGGTRWHRWRRTAEHDHGSAAHQRIATAFWGTVVRSWLCPARTLLSLCETEHGRHVAGWSAQQWQRRQHHLGRLVEQLAPVTEFDTLPPDNPGRTVDLTGDDDTW